MEEDTPKKDTPDQLPITAYFTYHPENDRVQLDSLEVEEYLTITHISSGETDSQDKFVERLLSRWEEYLKQEERVSFIGKTYLELYLEHKKKIDKRYDSTIKKEQEKPSKYFKGCDLKELFGEDARKKRATQSTAEDLLKPHGEEYESYLTYKQYQYAQNDPLLRAFLYIECSNPFVKREVIAQNLLADSDRTPLHPSETVVEKAENGDLPVKNEQLQREQPVTEVSQENHPASNENGAVSTNSSTPSTSDSSPLTGEPLPGSTLLLPDTNFEPKAE